MNQISVPVLRLSFSAEDREFVHQHIDRVLDSGMLAMGPYTQEFEGRFASFTGANHAVAVSSGTAALELVLRGLGIEGRSVIVPTNTFLATAFSVMNSGNRVIFADSDPETFCLDPEDVAGRIVPDTAAVVLVHIGGIITPAVRRIQKLCEERGLHLIEDCAHAHGCSIDGQQAGTLGVAGAFSFFPTKVLTCGESGMVTTNDEGLADRIRMLRNHGKNPRLGNRMSEPGNNLRMSEITAVLGVQQMARATDLIAERRRVASFYDDALPGIQGLRGVCMPPGIISTYYKYLVYLDEGIDRGEIKRALKEEFSVSLTGEVYADLCHTEPLWQKVGGCGLRRDVKDPACARFPLCGCDRITSGHFPGAEYISEHHVCLPLYPGLTEEELTHVITSLRTAVSRC